MTDIEKQLQEYIALRDLIGQEKLTIVSEEEKFNQRISEERLKFENSVSSNRERIRDSEIKSNNLNAKLNGMLNVRLGDLIEELRKINGLNEFAYIECTLKFPYILGDYRNNIQQLFHIIENYKDVPKQFELSINHMSQDKKSFYYHKCIDIDKYIKFSDGRRFIDNISTTAYENNHGEILTSFCFTEPKKEMDMIIPFTASELYEDKFLFRPVSLLRKAVINCVNKTQKPTM